MSEIQSLIDFVQKSKQSNKWIEVPAFKLRLYIRRAKRCLGGELVETLDLAAFEVSERYRDKGLFTRFLALVESYATELSLVVFVECVHNERLRGFLKRHGYIERDLCYWKGVQL